MQLVEVEGILRHLRVAHHVFNRPMRDVVLDGRMCQYCHEMLTQTFASTLMKLPM